MNFSAHHKKTKVREAGEQRIKSRRTINRFKKIRDALVQSIREHQPKKIFGRGVWGISGTFEKTNIRVDPTQSSGGFHLLVNATVDWCRSIL